MSVDRLVGAIVQPPDVLAVVLPEPGSIPALVAPLRVERPFPLPVLFEDLPALSVGVSVEEALAAPVDVPLDEAFVDEVPVGVQHSSSAGPGQKPGVET
jgi:hypothetical protein